MTERAQALEAAMQTAAKRRVEQYRVDGYPQLADAVWSFCDEALRELRAIPPPPPVGSPTTPDMGQGWFVTAGRWGDSIVTIEEKSLSGKPDFTPEDQALVRGAALHLLAFIGQPTPVEPAGASEPPKKWIPTEGCTCYLCRAARLSPAPVSPVAPEPPTETECCREPIAADERFCQKCGHEARIQPAGEPAPCVWREKESGYESRQFDTACGGEVWLRMYQQFNFCPFCGHPLTVER